jgi:small subunit ribosomal protein S18
VENNLVPDCKQPEILKEFIDERGKILPRRATKLTAKTQRRLTREIKRARHLALLPFVRENIYR